MDSLALQPIGGDSAYLVGYVAGLATSVLWTVTSVLFTAAGRRLGATVVNAIRIVLAIGLLATAHVVITGVLLPDASGEQMFWLFLSGVIGLAIGDQALYLSFLVVGPRVALLVSTTAPLFAAAFGLLWLGEQLSTLAWLGVLMTITGVGWAVLERQPRRVDRVSSDPTDHPARTARGVMLAVIAAACQAAGLLFSKLGIGHGSLPPDQHMDPLAATLIRMMFAAAGVVPLIVVATMVHRRTTARRSIDRAGTVPVFASNAPRKRLIAQSLLLVGCGAIVGPFLGVWMSLVAADRAPVGIAQTLMSLSPVLDSADRRVALP